jgi:hypothetical protein
MAIVLHVDGTQAAVAPRCAPSFTLEELQVLVGGSIEVVALGDGRLLVLNEEGKLEGLPYNEQATQLARGCLFPGDVIVGTVVVVTEQELGD